MKKTLILASILFAGLVANAQTVMDFHRNDCNGNMHHLFADLDAGNAVILEFFMLNCTPCVTAGSKLEMMKSDLLASYPGRVKSYAIGFTNAYTCTDIADWVSTNQFTSMPMDSGYAMVTNYGGFGMPTVVILGGGTSHAILGSPYIGFTNSDTLTMAADVRAFLDTPTAIAQPVAQPALSIFPQPADDRLQIDLQVQAGDLQVSILDLTGQTVQTVYSGMHAAGSFSHTMSTTALPAGIYVLKLCQGNTHLSKRLVVAH